MRRERELRAISLAVVASRTRLGVDRLQSIESGATPLVNDGHGRLTARALALAIGADPDHAAALLAGHGGDPVRRPVYVSLPRGFPLRALLQALAVALVTGVFGWLVWGWWSHAEPAPSVVYRPDYVDRLLESRD